METAKGAEMGEEIRAANLGRGEEATSPPIALAIVESLTHSLQCSP